MFERTDRLGIPLGPGQPMALLHALGRRDDWQKLEVFGALLVDLFPLFAHPGVHLRSGFFGPAERALRAAGHHVSFVPADFRRFEEIARRFEARVIATAAASPERSLDCGRTHSFHPDGRDSSDRHRRSAQCGGRVARERVGRGLRRA